MGLRVYRERLLHLRFDNLHSGMVRANPLDSVRPVCAQPGRRVFLAAKETIVERKSGEVGTEWVAICFFLRSPLEKLRVEASYCLVHVLLCVIFQESTSVGCG